MRFVLTTLLFALVSSFAFAQTSLSVRAGYGSSNVRTDSELDAISDQFESASARSFGVYVNVPVGEIVTLRGGLETNRRGTTLDLGDDVNVFGVNLPLGATAKTRFSYVDLPLQLKASLPTTGAFRPYAFAGATLGYATGGNVRSTARAIIEFDLMTTKIDLDAIDYERFHAAATGGLGLDISFSETFGAFVEGRYEQSLTQPYDVPVVTAKTGFRGLNFAAGVTFNL